MATFLFAYCPQTLYGTGCNDTACSLIHDATYCDICGVICDPASSYDTHITSQKHLRRVAQSNWLHCSLCGVTVQGQHIWDSHVKGRLHLKTAKRHHIVDPSSVQPSVPPSEGSSGVKHCETCNAHYHEVNWQAHLSSRMHHRLEQHYAFRGALERANKDQHGVRVSHGESGVDFGIIGIAQASSGLQERLLITTDKETSTAIVSAILIGGKSAKNHGYVIQNVL